MNYARMLLSTSSTFHVKCNADRISECFFFEEWRTKLNFGLALDVVIQATHNTSKLNNKSLSFSLFLTLRKTLNHSKESLIPK